MNITRKKEVNIIISILETEEILHIYINNTIIPPR